MLNFDLKARTILYALQGSHAYGTAIETSDRDYRGIAVPPLRNFVSCEPRFEQKITQHPDSAIYDIRKFLTLAADCNPNTIELLFVADEHVIQLQEQGQWLREQRDLFLSRKARHTFAGYAHAQLKRIRGHRAWLLDPPKGPPTRAEWGLPEDRKALNASAMGAIDALAAEGYEFGAEAMRIIEAEKRYAQALKHWQSFQKWQKERNPARAALEAKHGYDTKHAMHLVRLLRMCEEILSGQGVIVKRPDAEELLAIRRGEWSYDDLLTWAEAQEARCAALYETSPLPWQADREAIDDLCERIVLSMSGR